MEVSADKFEDSSTTNQKCWIFPKQNQTVSCNHCGVIVSRNSLAVHLRICPGRNNIGRDLSGLFGNLLGNLITPQRNVWQPRGRIARRRQNVRADTSSAHPDSIVIGNAEGGPSYTSQEQHADLDFVDVDEFRQNLEGEDRYAHSGTDPLATPNTSRKN